MNLNIAEVKAALEEAGHAVSKGEQWLLSDMVALEHYAFLAFGMAKDKLHYGLAYVGSLPSKFPGLPKDDKAAADAPAA